MENKIKFGLMRYGADPVIEAYEVKMINNIRSLLIEKKWIGKHPIPYGNVSIRNKRNEFLITGTQTSEFKYLTNHNVCLVFDYDEQKNVIHYTGPTEPSSESISHYAIYTFPEVNAVIHIHSLKAWNNEYADGIFEEVEGEYGSKELFRNIKRLKFFNEHIFRMADHEGGFISFGVDLKSAYNLLTKYVELEERYINEIL